MQPKQQLARSAVLLLTQGALHEISLSAVQTLHGHAHVLWLSHVNLQHMSTFAISRCTHQLDLHIGFPLDLDALQTSTAEFAGCLSASKHFQVFVHLEDPARPFHRSLECKVVETDHGFCISECCTCNTLSHVC